MARTLGIDLTRARHAGLLAESSARRIATACAGCRALADCMAYVAAPPTARRRAPEFCALADIFDCMVNVSGGPK
ncbi:MAG: hypothetical protein D6811_11665 [Alphaproteobacteria bacterium]|nr:MAG: hypothetical protein D6811_11665 [Alphaproteobacteria bacterium]